LHTPENDELVLLVERTHIPSVKPAIPQAVPCEFFLVVVSAHHHIALDKHLAGGVSINADVTSHWNPHGIIALACIWRGHGRPGGGLSRPISLVDRHLEQLFELPPQGFVEGSSAAKAELEGRGVSTGSLRVQLEKGCHDGWREAEHMNAVVFNY